jgi:ABC-type dipeptide/oligopeptide/nickel transport system permease subunit
MADMNPIRAIRRSTAGLRTQVILGGGLFILICVLLIISPWISPYDPTTQNLPLKLSPPSPEHLLGTDQLGRDVLSRLLWGGRFSVSIASIVVVIIATTGTILGAMSARIGGLFDEILMRVVDALLSFPDVMLALLLVYGIGAGPFTLILALSIAGWTPFARMTRALTLEINTKDFMEAAEALGCSRRFIIFRHVLPNAAGPVLAQGFLRFGHMLITVGSLSYLGLGVQPPASDWGAMLADGQPYMLRAPWLVIIPGLAIAITALSVVFAGQGLQRGRKYIVSTPLPTTAAETATVGGVA